MVKTNGKIEDEAIGWVIRLRDAGESDWEAFTAWLEADPAHAAAYDEAALADAEAEALPPAPVLPEPANDEPGRHGRRTFLGWTVAACLALVGSYTFLGSDGGQVYETGPGQRTEIALEDGSRIVLNASSRLELDEDRPRFARLEKGEALFHVVHDDATPFEVAAGDALLRDLGTVFNVVHEEALVEVAVAEGEVLFNPDREARNLTPGMALRRTASGALWVGEVDAEGIGGWRDGRLVYAGAPLSRVAADLGRNLGLSVSVDPVLAARPFSGVIMLDGERTEVLRRASALLGLSARRAGDGWILTTGSGAPS